MSDQDAWVPVAVVARPHGVKGEIRLKVYNTESDILLGLEEVLVRLPDGQGHEVSVERARRADDAVLMKLYSVDDRDRAEEIRGAEICVRRRDFPKPEEGEFYAVDVVGSAATLNGEPLGEVAEIISYPTVEVMLVRAADRQGDWEIPLTEAYIGKIDLEAKTVEILTVDELERLPVKKPRKPRVRKDGEADGASDGAPDGESAADGDGSPE